MSLVVRLPGFETAVTSRIQDAFAEIQPVVTSTKGRLVVSTQNAGSAVIAKISNTGPRLDRNRRDSLFEPFATSKTGGTDFGLNVCRPLVKANGGKLETEETAGGAIFRFTLPLIQGRLQ